MRRPEGILATLADVDARELEEALCRLPSVDSVRVVADGGRISEIHVLASPRKPPKQVVRDVQSLAIASFGLTIDRRAVSVVQIDDGRLDRGDRPAIVDIVEMPDGVRVTVTVTLSWRDELYIGESVGAGASTVRPRLAGEAVLEALEGAVGSKVAFALDRVDITTFGDREIVLAQVVAVTEGRERLLVGSALVTGDVCQTAVRAVLDALNRTIPQLKR